MPRKPRDLTGQTFNHLTVLRPSPDRGFWTCQCSCGIIKDVLAQALTSGNTKSCGHMRSINSGNRLRDRSVMDRMLPKLLEEDMLQDEQLMAALTTIRNYFKVHGVRITKGQVECDGYLYDPKTITDSRLHALGYALLHGVATTHKQLGAANYLRATLAKKTMHQIHTTPTNDADVSQPPSSTPAPFTTQRRAVIEDANSPEFKALQAEIMQSIREGMGTRPSPEKPHVPSEDSSHRSTRSSSWDIIDSDKDQ